MKQILKEIILKQEKDLFNITKTLYDNPEIGLEEVKSSKLLVDYLASFGFEVEYPFIMATGFKGVYKSKKAGPKVAFLCEYDALPLIGHGCGHNMIGTMSIGASIALKEIIDEIGGTIYVFGTPAEENFGGKVKFRDAHVFDDMDVALMLHPSSSNGIGQKSSALIPVKFDFYGTSAHACNPYNGASALDAAIQTYQGINMLRQFTKQPSFIHGIVRDGGAAANIIPEHASLEYYFRSSTMEYAKFLEQRAKEIASGAAMQTRCKVEFSYYEEAYEDTKINYTLASKLKEIYQEIGLTNIEDVKEEVGGSTDIGACSKACPTIQGTIKIVGEEVNGHSREFACATISEAGKKALVNGAYALSLLALEFITNKEFKDQVKEEFNA